MNACPQADDAVWRPSTTGRRVDQFFSLRSADQIVKAEKHCTACPMSVQCFLSLPPFVQLIQNIRRSAQARESSEVGRVASQPRRNPNSKYPSTVNDIKNKEMRNESKTRKARPLVAVRRRQCSSINATRPLLAIRDLNWEKK